MHNTISTRGNAWSREFCFPTKKRIPHMGVNPNTTEHVRAPLRVDRIPTTIAFGSCFHPLLSVSPLMHITKLRPDVMLWMGDNTYADFIGLDAAYALLFQRTDFQSVLRAVPSIACLDDHDYGGDEVDASNPWKGYAVSLFSRYFNQQVPIGGGVYSTTLFSDGTHTLQIIMLDVRYHRSHIPRNNVGDYIVSDDAALTFLGEEQWNWLDSALSKSGVDLHVVCSPIQFVSDPPVGNMWGILPNEKARLQSALKGCSGHAIVLSGDSHYGDIQLADGILDVTSSGLTHGGLFVRAPDSAARVGEPYLGRNFGVLHVDLTSCTVRAEIRDVNGIIVRNVVHQWRQ